MIRVPPIEWMEHVAWPKGLKVPTMPAITRRNVGLLSKRKEEGSEEDEEEGAY